MALLGQVAERFGFAAAVFVLILLAIWKFGSAQTQDDFIRELLFQQVTHKPWVTLVFAGFVLNLLFGFSDKIGRKRSESREMKRLADEKSRLQEELLGEPLHHTEPTGPALGAADQVKPERKRVAVVGRSETSRQPEKTLLEEEEHEPVHVTKERGGAIK